MRIVILGGGFCGALAAKLLERKLPLAEITLIDKKQYFEYQPSIHKVIFNAEVFKRISLAFANLYARVNVITDEVVEVTSTVVKTKKHSFSFDYLIISIGIDYPILLDNKENIYTLKTGIEAAHIGSKVLAANRIVIVGGGLIGVEIAGELVTKTHPKELTIVHPHDRLIERNPPSASQYAKQFLERRGARIIFGEKVIKHDGHTFVTDKGTTIEADVGLWCAGIRCNTSFMKGFPETIFTPKKALHVNEYLQLQGYPNIFVGGDITSVPEEKTAQNAERHAHLITHNLIALINHQSLKTHTPRSAPLVISLGDHAAMLTTTRLAWNGILPAVLKKLIEIYILWKYRFGYGF